MLSPSGSTTSTGGLCVSGPQTFAGYLEQAVTVQANGELVAYYTGAVRDSAALIGELAGFLPRTSIPVRVAPSPR